MAVAAIGGLVVTVAVALYLVPVLCSIAAGRAERGKDVLIESASVEEVS
jgi:hypothetical protein